MLIINQKDIEKAVNVQELLKAIESTFLIQEENDFYMPDRSHLTYKNNSLLLMPCFRKDFFSTKLVSVFQENKIHNKPAIYGSVLLNCGESGEPLALINGSKLTALRTGAVGALGILYTTPTKASSIGLFGAGVQGYHQVLFACAVRNIKKVGIYDPANENMEVFIKKLEKLLPHIKFEKNDDAGQLLHHSEIIIAATNAENPVIPNDESLIKGKHFIGIGSFKPTMQEISSSVFKNIDQLFIDTPHAIHESGDLVYPTENRMISLSQIFTLGKLINKTVQLSENETTFFKSVGMALFDLEVANLIYRNCKEKNIGTEVEF